MVTRVHQEGLVTSLTPSQESHIWVDEETFLFNPWDLCFTDLGLRAFKIKQ